MKPCGKKQHIGYGETVRCGESRYLCPNCKGAKIRELEKNLREYKKMAKRLAKKCEQEIIVDEFWGDGHRSMKDWLEWARETKSKRKSK